MRYLECQKNHAVSFGGHAVDGCCEFIAAGEEGTLEVAICAAWRIQNSGIRILIPPSCFCVVVVLCCTNQIRLCW
ncbi:putative transcription factor ZF-HD family [Medicago truncatula]|uniref:Putative transcription factor ZF-HD family n=1 Tax=Medicago truncatula TaxID=3880 RepID=A0A396H264_MEDTR|nr:putative transcription factor ZF-HD family [Medicago truncatula]